MAKFPLFAGNICLEAFDVRAFRGHLGIGTMWSQAPSEEAIRRQALAQTRARYELTTFRFAF